MDVEERLSFNLMSSGIKRGLALMIYPTKTEFAPVSDSDDHIIGVRSKVPRVHSLRNSSQRRLN